MYEKLVIRCRDNGMKLCGHMKTDFWDAADAIEDLEKLTDAQLDIIKQYQGYLTKHRWIPVTERLPEKEVLAVNALRGSYGYHEYLVGYIGKNEESDSGYCCESEGEILMNVTHWQSLPTPPKEET